MKELIIIRHAKSSWDSGVESDFYRPLQQKGIIRAFETFNELAKKLKRPDSVISSPAIRAYSTACIFCSSFDIDLKSIQLEGKFYESSVSEILSVISNQKNTVNSLVIIGHNYDFSFLVNELSETQINYLKTAAYVCLSFKIEEWKDILKTKGKMTFYNHVEY